MEQIDWRLPRHMLCPELAGFLLVPHSTWPLGSIALVVSSTISVSNKHNGSDMDDYPRQCRSNNRWRKNGQNLTSARSSMALRRSFRLVVLVSGNSAWLRPKFVNSAVSMPRKAAVATKTVTSLLLRRSRKFEGISSETVDSTENSFHIGFDPEIVGRSPEIISEVFQGQMPGRQAATTTEACCCGLHGLPG